MTLGQVITVGDNWYRVHRTVKFSEAIDPALLREAWHCTHTFRKEDLLYFVREIPVVDFEEVSDIHDNLDKQ
jgi:hypothetical protein